MTPSLRRLVTLACCAAAAKKPPHIVTLISDDLGWNNIGFHNNVTLHTTMQKAITVFQNFYNGTLR